MIPALLSAGFVVGVFVGISGVGGGSIMTPLLIIILGINPVAAVGTDLLYSVPTKIFGAYLHARQRTVDWVLTRTLCVGGLPGAALGIAALFALKGRDGITAVSEIVRYSVGAALILASAALVGSTIVHFWRLPKVIAAEPGYSVVAIAMVGAVTGFVVAVTSIGSGAVMLPMLLLLASSIGMRRLVGTDIAFAAVLIPVAAMGHVALHDVNFAIAGFLLAGALPGVFVGSKLCRYLPETALRLAIAVVLLIAASRLL